METKKCAVCEKPVEQTPGKKEKKYCSSLCRQKDWQRKQREMVSKFKSKVADIKEVAILSATPGSEIKTTSDPEIVKDYKKRAINGMVRAAKEVEKTNKAKSAPKTQKTPEPQEKKQEALKEAENGSLVFPEVKKKGRKVTTLKSSVDFKPTEAGSYDAPRTGDGLFMGIEIPSDLVGIDLSIWKAEIKEKSHAKDTD